MTATADTKAPVMTVAGSGAGIWAGAGMITAIILSVLLSCAQRVGSAATGMPRTALGTQIPQDVAASLALGPLLLGGLLLLLLILLGRRVDDRRTD